MDLNEQMEQAGVSSLDLIKVNCSLLKCTLINSFLNQYHPFYFGVAAENDGNGEMKGQRERKTDEEKRRRGNKEKEKEGMNQWLTSVR